MRMKNLVPLLLSGCILAAWPVFATEVSDNFNGTEVDRNIWQEYLGFANSSATETNGYARLRNGAQLVTWDSFAPPFEMTGRLRFSGSAYDNFALVFRTTGMRHVDSLELTNGISIRIEPSNGAGAGSNTFSAQRQSDSFVYATANRALVRNQFYDFKLTDSGTNFSFYFGDLTTPLLAGTESANPGQRIALYNHLAAPGPVTIVVDTQVDIDFVDISSPPPLKLNIYTAVELEFLGELGKLYQIQASPDSQMWTNLNEQIQGDGGLVDRLFSTRGASKIFYRAQEVPSPDQNLIDRAQAAPGIAECIAKARLQGLKIGVGVTSSSCPSGGDQKQVVFSGSPNCEPGQICAEFIVDVATVTFDCSGQIVSAVCTF